MASRGPRLPRAVSPRADVQGKKSVPKQDFSEENTDEVPLTVSPEADVQGKNFVPKQDFLEEITDEQILRIKKSKKDIEIEYPLFGANLQKCPSCYRRRAIQNRKVC